MATVTVTITDRPSGMTAVIESDPPIPLNGTVPDVDNPDFTNAMAAAVYVGQCLHNAAGEGEWKTLVKP